MQVFVVNLLLAQNIDKAVTYQLAGAKLTLGWTDRLAALGTGMAGFHRVHIGGFRDFSSRKSPPGNVGLQVFRSGPQGRDAMERMVIGLRHQFREIEGFNPPFDIKDQGAVENLPFAMAAFKFIERTPLILDFARARAGLQPMNDRPVGFDLCPVALNLGKRIAE